MPFSYAPEVSLKAFEAGGGEGYLTILGQLSREHAARQYLYLTHPLVDSALRLPQPWDTSDSVTTDPKIFYQRAYVVILPMLSVTHNTDRLTRSTIRRMQFISWVVWNVMLSFYGLSETILQQRVTRKDKHTPFSAQH